MKQSKIISTYNTLSQLADFDFSENEQWEIYKLRKFLRPHFDYQQEREDALREKYSGDIDEEGMIKGEAAQSFMKDMNAIANLEIELEEFEKPKLHVVKGVTCKLIEPLEDFVEFLPPAE